MAHQMKIPTVGESITEVTIASWAKEDGAYVEMDEIICELESDKATFELAAEKAGILKHGAAEGDTLEIGALVATIEEGGGPAGKSAPKEEKKEQAAPAPKAAGPKASGEVKEMVIPPVGESITEVVLSSWLVEEGEMVTLDQPIAELESDKATLEFPAEAEGKLIYIAKEGDTLEIGAKIAKIEVMEGVAAPTEKAAAQTSAAPVAAGSDGAAITPVAAQILKEKGIDPASIKGTGTGGKITKEDAMAAQKGAPEAAPASSNGSNGAAKAAAPEPTGPRHQERKKLSGMRKTIARRLVAVKNETAMLTTFNEVDMKPIMDLRAAYKEKFKEKYEVGLGFMSFFVKACTTALKEWPAVNAYIDGDEMVMNDYVDMSIAVSSPKGLVVPVIRNAEGLGFHEIEGEIVRLAKKARDGQLSIDEMTGGTFTITNGGIFGSMLSTPIINAPQSAILGMHNIVERPMAVKGEVVIRPIMYVALSYDHRVIDGRESVSFLYRLKELLEDPARLMLGI